MRYFKTHYVVGDLRIRTFFAWFPVEVGWPKAEYRWLEKVTVLEQLNSCWDERYWKILKFDPDPLEK